MVCPVARTSANEGRARSIFQNINLDLLQADRVEIKFGKNGENTLPFTIFLFTIFLFSFESCTQESANYKYRNMCMRRTCMLNGHLLLTFQSVPMQTLQTMAMKSQLEVQLNGSDCVGV